MQRWWRIPEGGGMGQSHQPSGLFQVYVQRDDFYGADGMVVVGYGNTIGLL